ncbi:MAG: lectin-like protein [Candidatus Poribacteria bacterium]|nr:lectin-like protein [Candidatus Poribacteria bacterium]
MAHLCFRRRVFTVFIGIVALLLVGVWESDAQKGALTTFTGRVVDGAGHPIAGLTVVLVPVADGHGAWFPIEVNEREWPDDPMAFQAETDAEGRFAITDAIVGPVLLGLFPYHKPEAHILKVQIGDIFLYAPEESWGRGIVFSAEPGERIEDVEVTVQRFLQFRGKVLKMDGSPLVNAQRVKFRVRQLSLDGEYNGRTSWTTETNAEGNFVQYIPPYVDGPMFYFMSVTCRDGSAQLDPIVVRPSDLMHEAIFTFETPLIPDVPGNAVPRFHGGLDATGVWIVNPENGHAYKKVRFSGVEDAIAQAAKEDAYLVAINDAAEQHWLERALSPMRTLIGLSDIEEEGQWQWHSGEPLTYTNWAQYEPQDTDNGDEDYVIMMGDKWIDMGPGDIRWRFVQTVLFEKEKPPVRK